MRRLIAMDVFVQLERKLGIDALSQGLFYRHHYALRLELSQGGTHLEQFISAIDRVRVLVDDLFAASPLVTAVVRSFMARAHDEGIVYAQLRELGVEVPRDAPRRTRRITPDDPEAQLALEIALPLAPRGPEMLALLWAVCGADHGVEPRASVELYLVDLGRALVFHPYDDRGADIVAAEPGPLLPTWRCRHAWALDYDLPRMTSTFGPHVHES
jgi:hypothetical protein